MSSLSLYFSLLFFSSTSSLPPISLSLLLPSLPLSLYLYSLYTSLYIPSLYTFFFLFSTTSPSLPPFPLLLLPPSSPPPSFLPLHPLPLSLLPSSFLLLLLPPPPPLLPPPPPPPSPPSSPPLSSLPLLLLPPPFSLLPPPSSLPPLSHPSPPPSLPPSSPIHPLPPPFLPFSLPPSRSPIPKATLISASTINTKGERYGSLSTAASAVHLVLRRLVGVEEAAAAAAAAPVVVLVGVQQRRGGLVVRGLARLRRPQRPLGGPRVAVAVVAAPTGLWLKPLLRRSSNSFLTRPCPPDDPSDDSDDDSDDADDLVTRWMVPWRCASCRAAISSRRDSFSTISCSLSRAWRRRGTGAHFTSLSLSSFLPSFHPSISLIPLSLYPLPSPSSLPFTRTLILKLGFDTRLSAIFDSSFELT
ncbi:hypothetical protein C7M84_022580 [Penaeus vannamei]|uniref:Uncharacterized protein n=1 Tax=Penaeus vannamei TaxID=6689 RepID=A0A3R7QMX1_PENVA|nr:hypothetical protein C7M84_022580 [Penaeus vannamei]